ncbi:MAG: DUF433 domain-containing protein [Ilumatobacteraceae bacterium]
MRFDRINVDHRIMGGLPCIVGTRIPVATVVSLVAEGESADQIVAALPHRRGRRCSPGVGGRGRSRSGT